ncbi:probably extracellular solute-binding protein, family 3:slt [gamma proteobacterium HdN1]|nr:probably extracellular solute-binding protein, family 3:slt [gamma proteobacterium HdN1]
MKLLTQKPLAPKLLAQKVTRTLAASAISAFLLLAPNPQPEGPVLDRIQQSGQLVVATRNDPSTYFKIGSASYAGFEHDLVTRYADSMGLDVVWKVYGDIASMLNDLDQGKVDLVAAGLPVTPKNEKRALFAPSYNEAAPVLVYRNDFAPPSSTDAIAQSRLVISAQAGSAPKLETLRKSNPDLLTDERRNLSPTVLLSLLAEGEVDYVVLNDNVFNQLHALYPSLRKGEQMDDRHAIAWALNRSEDASFLASLQEYFAQVNASGFLDQLREQYFSERSFDYVGSRTFLNHIDSRLPRYSRDFKRMGQQTELDWRLLAAMGYQESLWNPNAISPTGVTGLMMLTKGTAREVGVKDRRDPTQSIEGGARYFKQIYEKLPDVPEPHRIWFSLAAYNMGMGPLIHARKLTAATGDDPDNWFDVKKHLLAQSRSNPRYTNARQALAYVRNIRHYYDALVWLSAQPVKSYQPLSESVASLSVNDLIL